MGDTILYLITVVVAVIVAFISDKAFKDNEPLVIEKQREEKEYKDNEKEIPEVLKSELIKSRNKSIFLIKLRLISITIAGCVTVFALIKLAMGI